jgi:hypothetical protein
VQHLEGGLGDALLRTMPTERAGIASAVFNASREVAGLLGITIIGAVLRARQSASLHQGASPTTAYLHGYQSGLLVTVALVAAGAVVSFVALRRIGQQPAPAPQPVPAAPSAPAAEAADGDGGGDLALLTSLGGDAGR